MGESGVALPGWWFKGDFRKAKRLCLDTKKVLGKQKGQGARVRGEKWGGEVSQGEKEAS